MEKAVWSATVIPQANLNVGSPDGAMVSFYHLDDSGYQWDIRYEMYSQAGGGTQLYLLRLEDTFYSVSEGVLVPLEVTVLNALAFMMYGFEEKPTVELLTPLANRRFTSGSQEQRPHQ